MSMFFKIKKKLKNLRQFFIQGGNILRRSSFKFEKVQKFEGEIDNYICDLSVAS